MNALAGWLDANWFTLIQTVGIVFGLLFSGLALRSTAKTTRLSNLLQFTSSHREIWSHTIEHPELNRVLDPVADPSSITDGERTLINFLILNAAAGFRAIELDAVVSVSEFSRDVGLLMRLPIPSAVWNEYKRFHETDFVGFVDHAVAESLSETTRSEDASAEATPAKP